MQSSLRRTFVLFTIVHSHWFTHKLQVPLSLSSLILSIWGFVINLPTVGNYKVMVVWMWIFFYCWVASGEHAVTSRLSLSSFFTILSKTDSGELVTICEC
eukprot:TRINITY_DN111685_c0_g1_i1.p1 TRINITY_DN111685_c0_g1~~TRINITY_DN111685_c0_g1_i1.p1  ORF type:complete len:100 (+),score=0.06 TRINITY_DN111685_c0_g1_i1:92-391(+)